MQNAPSICIINRENNKNGGHVAATPYAHSLQRPEMSYSDSPILEETALATKPGRTIENAAGRKDDRRQEENRSYYKGYTASSH